MPGDRTEQATPHRREKARKEGDILHSRELTAATGFLAGVLILASAGASFVVRWRKGFEALLAAGSSGSWESRELLSTGILLRSCILGIVVPVTAVLVAVFIASLGAGVLQIGGLSVYGDAIRPRLSRINPVVGLKNVFSLRAVTRLGKSLIPAAALLVFAVHETVEHFAAPAFSTTHLLKLSAGVYGLLTMAAVLLFGWSAVDYAVEWRSRESRLKMSREDLRQEFKETEGSPQIRSRIRGLQRQMRRRKVKADVSRAAVVLTNPTHYAVALGFDFVSMDAPKVLAKGRNLRAEEIKSEARWAGVPIIENPPLARSLYRSVEAGEVIPVELYAAVAAILAFLYRQRVEEEMRRKSATVAPGKRTGMTESNQSELEKR